MDKILPGMKVKCKVTGYVGIVDHRSEYLHSAPRLGLQAAIGKDGKVPDAIMIDESQAELVSAKRVVSIDPTDPQRFPFGQKVRDPITGLEGKIIGRAVYMNGCVNVGVQPELLKGEMKTSEWFNEKRVEAVGKVKQPESERIAPRTGGPAPSSFRKDNSFR